MRPSLKIKRQKSRLETLIGELLSYDGSGRLLNGRGQRGRLLGLSHRFARRSSGRGSSRSRSRGRSSRCSDGATPTSSRSRRR